MSEQPETPQKGSVKVIEPAFSEETMRRVAEKRDKERAYQASKNPKGVPVIFPDYD